MLYCICTVYKSVYECVQARHHRVDGGRRESGRVCIRAQSGLARRVTILNGIVHCLCLFDQSWIHSSIHFRARPIRRWCNLRSGSWSLYFDHMATIQWSFHHLHVTQRWFNRTPVLLFFLFFVWMISVIKFVFVWDKSAQGSHSVRWNFRFTFRPRETRHPDHPGLIYSLPEYYPGLKLGSLSEKFFFYSLEHWNQILKLLWFLAFPAIGDFIMFNGLFLCLFPVFFSDQRKDNWKLR